MPLKITNIGEVIPGRLESASAVEVFDNTIYIAGDDQSYIYRYTKQFFYIDKIPLVENATDGPLPKKKKNDWEALTILTCEGKPPMLLLVASGSKKEHRNKAVLINLTTKAVEPVEHWPAFYDVLRSKLNQGDELNIEGLAQVGDKLVFFNRGNIKCGNYIFIVPVAIAFGLTDEVRVIHSDPKDINNTKAGFTGAYYIESIDTLLYTAAAEFVNNAYDDGQVMGSAIGYFANFSKKINNSAIEPDGQEEFIDKRAVGKLESLAVTRQSDNNFVLLAVTDNDGLPGSLFELILSL